MTESMVAEKDQNQLQASANTVVSFHYRMSEAGKSDKSNEWLESSYEGEPLYYLHGFNNIIKGVETALEGMRAGDTTSVTLDPISAYGPVKENAIQRVPIKHLQFAKPTRKIKPGMVAAVKTENGAKNVVVVKVGKFNADVDFNHPLAGKTLHYELEVVKVRAASEEEIAHRHVHGEGGHHH